jgi:hypothetical protein
MELNGTDPISELIEKLNEIKLMPAGPDRDAAYEEAQALFAPAAEELTLLGDHIEILTTNNQNGDSTTRTVISRPSVVSTPSTEVPPGLLIKSRRETWRDYWNRKKGTVAIAMTLVAALFFYANQRNIKMLDDFIHDEDLVGEFEDWAQTEEELRETPVDWRERQDAVD